MTGIVTNQGYTLVQSNQHLLNLLNKGNATLTRLEEVGRDCCVAKEECAAAQKEHAKELAELTEGVKKLDALLKKLMAEDSSRR